MRRAVLIFTLATSVGCAGGLKKAHKNAYIAGAVTKSAVEEAHQFYSAELNKTADKCGEESKSEAEFDSCIGIFANNGDVVLALSIYKQAAEVLFKLLKDPDASKERLVELRNRVIAAATSILALMPDGTPGKSGLTSILGK